MITKKTRIEINKFCIELFADLIKVFDGVYVNNITKELSNGFIVPTHPVYNKSFDNYNLNEMCNHLPYDEQAIKYYSEILYFCGNVKIFTSIMSYMVYRDITETKITELGFSESYRYRTKAYIPELSTILMSIATVHFFIKAMDSDCANTLWSNILDTFDKHIDPKKYPKCCKWMKKQYDGLKLYKLSKINDLKMFKYKIQMFIKYLLSPSEDATEWLMRSVNMNYDPSRKSYGDMFIETINMIRRSLSNINDERIFELFKKLRNSDFKSPEDVNDSINHVIDMVSSTTNGIDKIISNNASLIIEFLYHREFSNWGY